MSNQKSKRQRESEEMPEGYMVVFERAQTRCLPDTLGEFVMTFVSDDTDFRKFCDKLNSLHTSLPKSGHYLQWDEDHGDECIKRHLKETELQLLQKILQSPDEIRKHIGGNTQLTSLRSIGDWKLRVSCTDLTHNIHAVYHIPIWLEFADPTL